MKYIIILISQIILLGSSSLFSQAPAFPQSQEKYNYVNIKGIGKVAKRTFKASIDNIDLKTFNPKHFDFFWIKYYNIENLNLIDSLTILSIELKKGIKEVSHKLTIGDQSKPSALETRYRINLKLSNVNLLDNLIISNFAFSNIEFNNVNASTIHIKDSKIKRFRMSKCTINNSYSFEENEVKDFFINDCHFQKSQRFENNKFQNDRVIFMRNIFKGSYTSIRLQKEDFAIYQIQSCKFYSTRTEFIGNKYHFYPFGQSISNCYLEGEVRVKSSKSENMVTSYNRLDFNNLKVKGEMKFYGKLPEYLSLRNTSITGIVDFTNVDIDTKCKADFYSSDLKNIEIYPRNFNFTRLNLNKTKFKNQNYKLKEYNKIETVYKHFLNKTEKEGLSEEYKKWDLKHKRYRYYSIRSSPFERIYYFVAKGWWNFGYDKYRILYWTILFLSVFIIVNSFLLSKLLANVYTIDKIKEKFNLIDRKSLSTIQFNLKKLELSSYYTLIIFFGFKLESDNFYYEEFLPTMYIYLTYVIGILCMAFIFNYIFSI